MPPCTGTFGAVTSPKRLRVQATSTNAEAVYSLTVVVLPRDNQDTAFEHFVFTRTALENGTAAWDLEPSRIYRMAIIADRAVEVTTTLDLPQRQIFNSVCKSDGPGLVGSWTLPTRRTNP